MWSLSDEQELLVYADALMNAGHASGEVMARELCARISRDQPTELTPCVDGELADFLAEHPVLEARLEAGVMVGAKLWPRKSIAISRLLDIAAGLLSLDASRWLRSFHVATSSGDQDLALLPLLQRDGLVARPRVIIIGPYPSSIRCATPASAVVERGDLGPFAAASSGLHTLIIPGYSRSYSWSSQSSGRIVELPWAEPEQGKDARATTLGQLHARAEAEGGLSLEGFTRCARALWDPSRRVRNKALAGLPLFGRAAAQVLPEVLIPGKIQGCTLTIPPEVTVRLRQREELLEAIAANFTVEQLHAAKWALSSPRAAHIARDRAQAFDNSRARKWARTLRPPLRVNVNDASAADLQQIPGIGPVYAARILALRARRAFESIEQLRDVPGIGPRNFTRMAEWLYIAPARLAPQLGRASAS